MTNNKQNIGKIWLLGAIFAILLSIPFLIPHCGFISLFAIIPLFMMENIIATNNIKHRFLYFYCAFLLFNLITTFWVWNASAIGSIAAFMLNALQMSIIFTLFSFIKGRIKRTWIAYFAFVAMWLAWEHCYFNIEITWPWLVLGNSLATSPYLVQWYEITGTLGGSLWILLSNILLYYFCTERKKCQIFAAIALITIPVISSLIRFATYKETDNPIEVLAIQPNIDPYDKFGVVPQSEIDQKLLILAEQNLTPKTKYLITPETFTYVIDIDRPEQNNSFRTYLSFLRRYPETTMVLGSMTQEIYLTSMKPTKSAREGNKFWYDIFNASLTLDENGLIGYHYKSKLVPGTEIIPYQNTLKFLTKWLEKSGIAQNSYGIMDKVEPLPGKDGNKVGTLICYESVYGEYARKMAKNGANFIAIMTNDGWWGDTPGYKQHFRYAKLRAIEMRRDIVRAANTGTSGIIDQKGCVKQKTDYWVEDIVLGDINLNSKQTFFTKYGDLIGLTACWLMIPVLILLLYFIFKKKK